MENYYIIYAFGNPEARIYETEMAHTVADAKSTLREMKKRFLHPHPVKFTGLDSDDCEDSLVRFEIVRVVDGVGEEDAYAQTPWYYVNE